MHLSRLKFWGAASAVALGSVVLPLGLASRITQAEPPVQEDHSEEHKVIRGTVRQFLKNDHEDIDGVTLDGGVDIRFPPHIGREVTRLAKVGDELAIQAERVTRPRGETVLEARRIERDGKVIEVDHPPRGPKGKPGPMGRPGEDVPMKARGAIAELLSNPHGELDGFRLKDDTEVKFPPHLGAELEAIIKPGELVRIDGRKHITPKGDVHLHADRIEVVATGTAIERHPPKPTGPGGPWPEPLHENARTREFDALQRTQDQILQEVRDLRKLLEKGAS
jgi:hypothetical protein